MKVPGVDAQWRVTVAPFYKTMVSYLNTLHLVIFLSAAMHHFDLDSSFQSGRWGGLVVKAFARQDEDPGSIHMGTLCETHFWCSQP